MAELRLILLIIGVLIIAGVFFFSRSPAKPRHQNSSGSPLRERTEPVLPASMEALDQPAGSKDPALGETEAGNVSDDSRQKIIVLHILPTTGPAFDGRHLLEALQAEGLEYGTYDIFHYGSQTRRGTNLFSIANMMEPGDFDLQALPEQNISGLAVFSVLPVKKVNSVDVFAEMLAVSRRIAERLGGEVTDESRSTLTRQTAHHLRESIVKFEAQLGRNH